MRNEYCNCLGCIIEWSSFAPAIWVSVRPKRTKNMLRVLVRHSSLVIDLSFVIRISSLQSWDAEPTGDFRHLRLRKCLALFDCLFHCAQNHLFKEFDVVGIDNFFINLECDD